MVTEQIATNPPLGSWLVDNTPVGFVGSAEDIAGSVAFLVSDASNYMHGAVMTLDGGWSARARG
jgi:NAD(P)-dependent dehydrogenase (short-subunit alcohol dehydrogenase family)